MRKERRISSEADRAALEKRSQAEERIGTREREKLRPPCAGLVVGGDDGGCQRSTVGGLFRHGNGRRVRTPVFESSG